MKTVELWDKSLQTIQAEVGPGVFDLWFKSMKFVGLSESHINIEVPNRFFKEWVEDYHPTLIQETLEKLSGKRYEVKFVVATKSDSELAKVDHRHEIRKTRLAKKGIYLNPKYTFDNFVVGASNQFAHAAASAASENPGKTYNPLFIYGGVGLGKTHLITAIGNRVVDDKKQFNILYVSSEQFTNEVVSAIRHGKTEELKQKYRSLDMLLLDDVQLIENKQATQEELFHTLNVLYENQKQIVLSSDRPPKEIRQVTDRLRSRFTMGLIADIQLPDVETKVAIVLKKSEADKISLPDDVVQYIARRVRSNVRDIEGCLIRLGAHSSLSGQPISLDMAKNVLKDFISEDEDRPLSVETIMKVVCEYFGIKVQDMKARKRTKEIAAPRQIAMYLSRELTGSSLNEIGKHMGGKDHATVLYAAKQVEARRTADEDFNRMIDSLINKLKA